MKFKKALALLLCMAFFLPMLVLPSNALETYTVKLNETLQLHLIKNLTITSAEWQSSDARIVKVVSSSLLGCTVMGVDNSAGTSALITCTYKYLLAGRIFVAYEHYRINVPPKSSGTGGGSIGLFADPNTVTLDLAENDRQEIILRANGNLPKAVGCSAELPKDSAVSYWTGELLNHVQTVTLCGNKVGREYVQFILYEYAAPADIPLAHVTVTVNVTCSHRYGRYGDVEPATADAPGVYNQICECCGDVQPVEIPAGLSAKAPVIFRQPEDARYKIKDIPQKLTVSAFVYDGGELRYDWYRNDQKSVTGGAYVGSGAEYTPPTDVAGTNYYYAVAVNTKNDGSGETAASAASEIAAVTVVTPETDFEYSVYQSYGSVTIKKYNGTDEHVVVPDEIEGYPVKEIALLAFAHNQTIRTIQLPSRLATIGRSAFAGSTLTEIELPQTVTNINYGLFLNCAYLQRVVLGENVRTIGEHAFRECSRLEEIVIPASVTTIDKGAFYQCPKLTTVRFCNPTDNYTINENAFGDCNKLRSIYFCGDYTRKIACKAFIKDNVTLYTPIGSTWTQANIDYIQNFATDAIIRWDQFSPLEYADITLVEGDVIYGGESHQPLVSVSYKGTELTEGIDYALTYKDDASAGTVSVFLTGLGKYSGAVRRTFAKTFTLNVVNGSGSGRYTAGEQISIAADAPPTDQVFDRWTTSGGGSFAADSDAATTFTMPAADVTVTAAYREASTITAVLLGDKKTVQVTGFNQPLPSGTVMLASRYEGGRMLKVFSGSLLDDGVISFNEYLSENDALFIMSPDSWAPLCEKILLGIHENG